MIESLNYNSACRNKGLEKKPEKLQNNTDIDIKRRNGITMIFKDMCYDEKDLKVLLMHEEVEGSFLAGARTARQEILERNFDYDSCKKASNLINELPCDTSTLLYEISKNYLSELLNNVFKWSIPTGFIDLIFVGVKKNSTLLNPDKLKDFLITLPKVIDIQKRFS